MKNKIIIGIVVVVVIVLGLGFIAVKNGTHVQTEPTVGMYCSPDGTLYSTKPIQSHRSYCLKSTLATVHLIPNEPVSYQFSIIDDEGKTLKDLQIAHDMLLHLIVVRKDLADFQHLHPDFDSTTGVFTLANLTFPSAGAYRLYADFVPQGAQIGPDGISLNVVLTEDVSVMGNYIPQSLTVGSMTKNVDGYEVTLSTDPKSLGAGSMGMLSFTIKKDGKAVTDLQPYLAALGHSVIIRENTLDYIHAHAVQEPSAKQTGVIDFHTDLPYGGNYKVFTQFKHNDKVITTDFVIHVSGGGPQAMPASMPGMDHSMQ